MNHKSPISLVIAVFSIALFTPQLSRAQDASPDAANPQPSNQSVNSDMQNQTLQLVPARAGLVGSLDARKIQPGQEIRAILNTPAHLKNGTDLPKGTLLVGTADSDTAQQSGKSLSLTFTKAELKSGGVVPIKATIFGAAPFDESSRLDAMDDDLNSPNTSALRFDVIDAINGVNLHSEVANPQSGVFVATRKDDIKLSANIQFALAIAAVESSPQTQVGKLQ